MLYGIENKQGKLVGSGIKNGKVVFTFQVSVPFLTDSFEYASEILSQSQGVGWERLDEEDFLVADVVQVSLDTRRA